MFKWLTGIFALLNFAQAIWAWWLKAKLKAEARGELAEKLQREEHEVRKETDDITNTDLSDDDLDDRMQSGKF